MVFIREHGRDLSCLALLVLSLEVIAQTTPPSLKIVREEGDGLLKLSSDFRDNTVLNLEASTNVGSWNVIGTFHDQLFPFKDWTAPNVGNRFYRLRVSTRNSSADWKNQILFPWDQFVGGTFGPGSVGIGWVKFVIPLSGAPLVYFQNGGRYPFHYGFATKRLPEFAGLTRSAFDSVTLHRTNQQAVLGSVLFAPGFSNGGGPFYAEYGVQFVGAEPYDPDEIAKWMALVRNSVYASNRANVYYMPTQEQAESARRDADVLAMKGVQTASIERWLTSDACYSAGWAVGRLKYVAAPDIAAAFSSGLLSRSDILMTDRIPAEIPMLAGIISLSPVTPNSHAVILARSLGIPFAYVAEGEALNQARSLTDRLVMLRAKTSPLTPEIKIVDVEPLEDSGVIDELLAARRPQAIKFSPKRAYGAFSARTDGLGPADIQYFGGKAANYGLLRRTIPQHAPDAVAFSFDLWDEFLDQVLPSGKTLRVETAERLAPFNAYPPDMSMLRDVLAGIRDLFTKSARFSPLQQEVITNALAEFSPVRKIRFRSSTNVEDAEHFTGAGLYDSFSGCLIDDLDGDSVGPCGCDPGEDKERGVFRAIQKVYASFYNDNAFLERFAHQVDEGDVAMGVLVHHSFPDEDELANGVASCDFMSIPGEGPRAGPGSQLVTQLGAESITNPNGEASPEVVEVDFAWRPYINQYSSRLRLGESVLAWSWDYDGLLEGFRRVASAFQLIYPEKMNFSLEFEYKKDRSRGLVIKQVRQLPDQTSTNVTVGFLVDEPVVLCIAQEQYGDVFTSHRLKSLWTLRTRSMRLSSTNLAQGIYTEGSLQYIEDGKIETLDGPLNSWPNAACSGDALTNSWTTGSGANHRRLQLKTALTTKSPGVRPTVFIASDFGRTLTVEHPVPVWTASGERMNESIQLRVFEPVSIGALQERKLDGGEIQITTLFYWPKITTINRVGFTAPLERFVQTRIEGLTTSPITLTNYFSQTYAPAHHNIVETFLFEPRLEPGISPSILAELETLDIQSIIVTYGYRFSTSQPPSASFSVIGRDKKIRPF